MYKSIFVVVAVVLALSIWEYQKKPAGTPEQTNIIDAVMLAATAAPKGVSGVFEMHVLAGGKRARFVYLNSEMDYRDQRNLTVAIPMALALEFKNEYGMLPNDYLKFRKIIVNGEAKRTRIYFYSNGVKTPSYYYQTQVRIASLDQIEIL